MKRLAADQVVVFIDFSRGLNQAKVLYIAYFTIITPPTLSLYETLTAYSIKVIVSKYNAQKISQAAFARVPMDLTLVTNALAQHIPI